jgi:hypothetical protein
MFQCPNSHEMTGPGKGKTGKAPMRMPLGLPDWLALTAYVDAFYSAVGQAGYKGRARKS